MPGMKLLATSVYVASLSLALAQQAAKKPAFEVASIKATDPNPENTAFIGMTADGARVKYTNITLRDCIRGAFRVRDFQIAGPEWMTKARYEINATLPAGASMDQIPEMLQALLEERFRLEIRREQKDTNVYALVVANGGAKLKPAEVKSDPGAATALGPDGKPRAVMEYSLPLGGVNIRAASANLESLVGIMSRFTARPVVDRTGIAGLYEFDLTFFPEANTPRWGGVGPDGKPVEVEIVPAPPVSDAVRKYGLQIEKRREPIEMIEVIRLEKTPTDN